MLTSTLTYHFFDFLVDVKQVVKFWSASISLHLLFFCLSTLISNQLVKFIVPFFVLLIRSLFSHIIIQLLELSLEI